MVFFLATCGSKPCPAMFVASPFRSLCFFSRARATLFAPSAIDSFCVTTVPSYNFCGHNCERGLVRDAGGRQVLHVCRRSAALCLRSYLWHAFSARWEINQGGHFAFGTHVAASKNLQKASGRCPGVFKCAVGFLPDLLGFFCDGFSAAADKFPRPISRVRLLVFISRAMRRHVDGVE